jgi:hypothetical protein
LGMAGMCGVGFEDRKVVDGCVVLDSKIRKMLMDGEETAAMKAPES